MTGSASPLVVAIDGPAGSGKSTVARRLASAIDLPYLDTGAMYRAVTFAVLESGVDLEDVAAVERLATSADIDVGVPAPGPDAGAGSDVTVRLNGRDVSAAIRSDEVTRAVSSVSAIPSVRAELVARQRSWVADRGHGLLEGRDIGSVVFPDAVLKIYLTATVEVRARRRAAQRGTDDWESIAADLARRDQADSSRADSPLVEAGDAFVYDTSDRGIEVVVKDLAAEFHRRAGERSGLS